MKLSKMKNKGINGDKIKEIEEIIEKIMSYKPKESLENIVSGDLKIPESN